MDPAALFLLGAYLIPLAFVSLVGAWAAGRRPYVAFILGAGAAAALITVALTRPEGLYPLRALPELTVALIAQLMALF